MLLFNTFSPVRTIRPLFTWRTIFRAIALLAFVTGSPPHSRAGNLLSNGDFETGTDDLPYGWGTGTANGAIVKVDRTVFRDGKKSLLLTLPRGLPVPKDAPPDAVATYMKAHSLAGFAQAKQVVPVDGGKSYNLRFWYKAEGLKQEDKTAEGGIYTHLQVVLIWLDANRKTVQLPNPREFVVLNEGHDATDWVQADNMHLIDAHLNTHPYVAPQDAAYVVIQFSLTVARPDSPAKVWLDDVTFDEQPL